jgi:hypothetical protein
MGLGFVRGSGMHISLTKFTAHVCGCACIILIEIGLYTRTHAHTQARRVCVWRDLKCGHSLRGHQPQEGIVKGEEFGHTS